MANLNNLFQRKEKSKEQIAREKLEKEAGDSGMIMGAIGCGFATIMLLSQLLADNSVAVKITAGVFTLPLAALTVFLAIIYLKQKNAMSDILEAFLAGERSISNLVVITGLNNKTATRIIQNMITKGIIDANIDILNNKLVDKVKTVASAENIGKTVLCTGCGAKNTLTGEVGQKCEYCGALLSEV